MTPRMLGSRVLLKVEPPSETKGLIVIPERSRSKPQEGEVIAVGPAVTTVKVGDRVLFGKWSVLEVQPWGAIMYAKDVMAVLDGADCCDPPAPSGDASARTSASAGT
jgi:chaperonin GroES